LVKPDFNKNSLLLKQYLRLIPAKLGLINKAAFKMQINEIRNSDLFLVSYPKSGNTWLRYIMATALKGRSNFSFDELENIIPDVYVSKTKINSFVGSRIIKSHDALFDQLPAVIYIYRDYRDVLMSYFHYAINTKEFTGTFKEFMRSDFPTRFFGSWSNHIKGAITAKKNGKKILILSYEDMLQNPELNISKILNFTQLKSDLSSQQIAELCNFTNLQKNERDKGSYFGTDALFFRKGEADRGRTGFDEDDINFLMSDSNLKTMMLELGYMKA
jgi:estrone sulfotransferase